jgi:hypothetical protein
MSSFHYMAGDGWNQLSRCVLEPVPSSADSILGNVSALWDYSTDEPFMWQAGAASLDIDLGQVVNGGFEDVFSGGLPGSGWGKSSGATLTRETASPYAGVANLKVAGNFQHARYDLSVRAGESLTVSVAAKLSSAQAGAKAQVTCLNLSTGSYLTVGPGGDGVWSSQTAAVLNVLSTEWNAALVQFTVEDFATCRSDMVTLRFVLLNLATGIGCEFDDVHVWPDVDTISIHGHNIPPGSAIAWANDLASHAVVPSQPTTWRVLGAEPDRRAPPRYWSVSMAAAPDSRQFWMRELVIGQRATLRRQRDDGAETVRLDPQDRSASDLGPLRAYLRGSVARRRMSIKLRHTDGAELAEWEEIMARSRNGAKPLLCVPDSTRTDAAMLCRVDQEWNSAHRIGSFYGSSVVLDELPFPALVS